MTISSQLARWCLLAMIIACLGAALVSLRVVFGNGAIGSENQSNAVFKILGFYLPLLSLLGTFLFKGGQAGESATPAMTFVFALVITGLWVVTPILLLTTVFYIEDVLGYIDKLIPVGQSLALMALGYFFPK
jgi:hypothetical protein